MSIFEAVGEGIGAMVMSFTAILVVLLIVIVYFVYDIGFGKTEIISKQPITPELRIEVKNGISDTTYIYKEN